MVLQLGKSGFVRRAVCLQDFPTLISYVLLYEATFGFEQSESRFHAIRVQTIPSTACRYVFGSIEGCGNTLELALCSTPDVEKAYRIS